MDRTLEPTGFSGSASGWHDIVPDGLRTLRWPEDALRDGGQLCLPELEAAGFDVIFVTGFVEGCGRLEDFVEDCVARLAPGGRLFFDAENRSSPRQLRILLEGGPNALDPVGSSRDPEIAVDVARLVAAAESAGLVVEDVLRLPYAEEIGNEFASSLIDRGFMATRYVGGTPAARLWLCASKREARAGTAVVAAGPAESQAVTVDRLRGILPADWDVLTIDAENSLGEVVDFNRSVASTAAAAHWWLRPGSLPTQEQFEAMNASVLLGAVVPGVDGVPATDGDLNGLMISRRDLMKAGPLDEDWAHPQLAHEDYGMRLVSTGVELIAAGGGAIDCAEPESARCDTPIEAAVLQAEAQRLVSRWEGVGAAEDPLYPGSHRAVRAAREGDLPTAPWRGRSPRVTLCMIARDEERFLDECLRRAAPAVDEIVLVDTGSTDRTIEIARSYGAVVVEREWTDDFAAARNAGLEHATGDWILVLDADEHLEDGAAEEIRRVVEDELVCGYHVHFTNIYDGGKCLGVTMVRLFRRLPGLRWANRIHEQVTPSLLRAARTERLVMSRADVRVLHYGYSDEVMVSRDKLTRNERLFDLQIAENPEDTYSLYKYGDFLRRCPGRSVDARAVLDRTLDCILEQNPSCPRGVPYAAEVAALCALEAAREEDWGRAEGVIEVALRRFMATPNLHYIAASIALRRGREDQAISHYRRCLTYRGKTLVVPVQHGITGHVALTGIAQAMLQKGDRIGAQRMLDQAIELDPEYDVASILSSRLHLAQGEVGEAIQALMGYLQRNPRSAAVCQQATLLLGQLGHKEQARRLGQRAIELFEADAAVVEAEQVREQLAALC